MPEKKESELSVISELERLLGEAEARIELVRGDKAAAAGKDYALAFTAEKIEQARALLKEMGEALEKCRDNLFGCDCTEGCSDCWLFGEPPAEEPALPRTAQPGTWENDLAQIIWYREHGDKPMPDPRAKPRAEPETKEPETITEEQAAKGLEKADWPKRNPKPFGTEEEGYAYIERGTSLKSKRPEQEGE